MRVELRVAFEDLLRDAFLVELRQALDRLEVHAADIKEFLADRLKLGVLGLDEREQGHPALVHERVIIEGDAANLIEGETVPEEHVQRADLILRGHRLLRERRDELVPGGRLGRLAPALEAGRQSGDDVRLPIRHLGGLRQQVVQRTRLLIRSLGEPTGDEPGHLRNAADMGAVRQLGQRQFADARPHEQWQVMVGRVLFVTQQVLGDERAHGRGEVRKGLRQGEADTLTVRGRSQLEQRALLLVAGRDETGVVRILGQGVIPAHQRLGEFAFNQACLDIGPLLRDDGGRRVMGAVSRGEGLRPRPGRGHRPQRRVSVEREHRVGLGGEFLPGGQSRREVGALPGTLAEFPARHADEPFVRAALQVDQLGGRGLGQVDVRPLGRAVRDLEDAAAGTMDAVLVMALSDIAPVEDRDRAVRSLAQLDPAKPEVIRLQDIGLVLHHQRAADALEGLHVDASTMEIERHQLITVLARPVLALVDHHPHVRMTATEAIGPAATAVRIVPLLAGVPVVVVRLLVDELVDERVRILAVHALEVRTVDTLPAMPDDRVDEE